MTSRGQLIPAIDDAKKRLVFECGCGHEIRAKLESVRKVRDELSSDVHVRCSKCHLHYTMAELRSAYTMLLVERMALLGDDSM